MSEGNFHRWLHNLINSKGHSAKLRNSPAVAAQINRNFRLCNSLNCIKIVFHFPYNITIIISIVCLVKNVLPLYV